jgi:NitT/TauT family transport system permease protein
MSRQTIERATPWIAVATIAAAWEIASRAGVVPVLFFPPPSRIAATLAAAARDGSLLQNVSITVARLAAGIALGGTAGVFAGVMLGWSPTFRRAVDPIVAALHPLPKIALLPLLMVIFGIGESSKIAAIAFGSFFPLAISTSAGVRQIPHAWYEVVESFGGTRRDVFRCVLLPGMLPMVLAGFRVTLNAALMVAVALEFVAAESGVGRMIWSGWQSLVTERLWAGLVILAAIGAASNALLEVLARRFVPWQEDRGA